MLTNWLQRAAGFREGEDVSVEDLIHEAARCYVARVQIDPLSWLALSDSEREALATAPAAIAIHVDEDTWADRARADFVSRKAKPRG